MFAYKKLNPKAVLKRNLDASKPADCLLCAYCADLRKLVLLLPVGQHAAGGLGVFSFDVVSVVGLVGVVGGC